jgi:hypothetical protein
LASRFRPIRLFLIALPLPLLAVWHYLLLSADVAGYSEESGVIVGYHEVPPAVGDTQVMYRYIVEYEGAGGSRRRVVSHVARGFPKPIGDHVRILVEPVGRNSAYVTGAFDYWFPLTVTILFSGTPFVFLAMFPIAIDVIKKRSRLRRRRRYQGSRNDKTMIGSAK